jgi:hypothetical protein
MAVALFGTEAPEYEIPLQIPDDRDKKTFLTF